MPYKPKLRFGRLNKWVKKVLVEQLLVVDSNKNWASKYKREEKLQKLAVERDTLLQERMMRDIDIKRINI